MPHIRNLTTHRLNVLWVIDHVCYDGSLHGGGRLYWNVLSELERSNVNVVPCMLRASEEIRELFEDCPVPVTILDKGRFDLTTLSAFLRIIKRERIDVMHVHCYGAATFGRLASLVTGVPVIIHDYDTAVYFGYPWYLKVADRLLRRRTAWAFAASPMVRDHITEARTVDPERVELMLHAVPERSFELPPAEAIRDTRAQLGIADDATVIGTVNKLGPRRGNRYFLHAIARAAEALPNAVFVLAYKPTVFHCLPNQGFLDGPLHEHESDIEELHELARELRIESRVRFVEATDDSGELVASFDVFVAPYLSAHFSSVPLLEAMAKARVVVATNMGEQAEILKDGVNGRLVRPGDADALSTALIDVLENPEELNRLRTAARETARRRDVGNYTRILAARYEELARTGRISIPAKPETIFSDLYVTEGSRSCFSELSTGPARAENSSDDSRRLGASTRPPPSEHSPPGAATAVPSASSRDTWRPSMTRSTK